MTIRITYLLSLFLILGCAKMDTAEQIENLDGYWEIVSVTQPDGSEKTFKISTLVDHIAVTDSVGVRTKVAPQLDGSFKASESRERFYLKVEEDSLRLYYETPYSSWMETVLEAKNGILRIQNKEHKIYTYKTFEKFTFE